MKRAIKGMTAEETAAQESSQNWSNRLAALEMPEPSVKNFFISEDGFVDAGKFIAQHHGPSPTIESSTAAKRV